MKYIGVLLGLFLSAQGYAFNCYLTMVKAECWKAYDLTVEASDAATGKAIKTVMVPEDNLWSREAFECRPGTTISLVAQFSPVFWTGQENKTYPGKRFWKLPNKIRRGETGWNVTVCYPKDFSDVPAPPDANINCTCDLKSIPKIEPPPKS